MRKGIKLDTFISIEANIDPNSLDEIELGLGVNILEDVKQLQKFTEDEIEEILYEIEDSVVEYITQLKEAIAKK